MTFRFVKDNLAEWPVAWMCDALEVSGSGYHAGAGRVPAPAARRRGEVVAAIESIHAEVRGRYGSPRMAAERNARGHACAEDAVAKLTREAGVRAKAPRRSTRTTDSRHALPVAGDVLARGFEPAGPDAAWSADITYVPTAEGWLDLAVVEDLVSRMVVGWAMGATMTSRLVADALDMALGRRRPGPGLLAHSDRGSQYAGEHDRGLLARHGITCGMSGVAQCGDNAPVESFFASLKKELVHDERYATRGEARSSIFESVESF